jgi:hypothetical protein
VKEQAFAVWESIHETAAAIHEMSAQTSKPRLSKSSGVRLRALTKDGTGIYIYILYIYLVGTSQNITKDMQIIANLAHRDDQLQYFNDPSRREMYCCIVQLPDYFAHRQDGRRSFSAMLSDAFSIADPGSWVLHPRSLTYIEKDWIHILYIYISYIYIYIWQRLVIYLAPPGGM